MKRVGPVLVLVVAAAALTSVYGWAALVLGAVAIAAVSVARFYAPLPSQTPARRLPRLSRRRPRRNELQRRRSELEWALRDGRQADAILRPGLLRIAEALVRGRLDRGLADDPVATRALLGPELDDYLGARSGRPPSAQQLDAMLQRLEGLQ